MWTVDMTRCPACPANPAQGGDCADRKKIVQTLSALTHELNTDPAFVDGPGDGIIIVSCRYQTGQGS
jgi:hypothetical protein